MAGLKDTLTLLSKGYTKKEIQELEKMDIDAASNAGQEEKKEEKKEEINPSEDKEPEKDYKKLYEDLLKKSAEDTKTIETLQKDNIRQNMGPDVKKAKEEEQASLLDSVRSFM